MENVLFKCGCGTGYCDVTECWNPTFVAVEHEVGACRSPGTLQEFAASMDMTNSCNYCSGLVIDGRCAMCGEA